MSERDVSPGTRLLVYFGGCTGSFGLKARYASGPASNLVGGWTGQTRAIVMGSFFGQAWGIAPNVLSTLAWSAICVLARPSIDARHQPIKPARRTAKADEMSFGDFTSKDCSAWPDLLCLVHARVELVVYDGRPATHPQLGALPLLRHPRVHAGQRTMGRWHYLTSSMS